MPVAVRVRVPAKVNLSLAVGPVRPDGFHELATVYQALSLFDEVEVIDRADGRGLKLAVAGRESATVPVGEGNLAWQAAELAGRVFDHAPDLTITIDKGIPVAGGMAGGSADAAAVLRACGHLWDPDGHPESELLEMAAELGSDVPFALLGGTAVGTGRGEVVTSAMGAGEFHWVLALSDGPTGDARRCIAPSTPNTKVSRCPRTTDRSGRGASGRAQRRCCCARISLAQ